MKPKRWLGRFAPYAGVGAIFVVGLKQLRK